MLVNPRTNHFWAKMAAFRGDVARVLAGSARAETFCLPRQRMDEHMRKLLVTKDCADSLYCRVFSPNAANGLEVRYFRAGDIKRDRHSVELLLPPARWGMSVFASVHVEPCQTRACCAQQQVRYLGTKSEPTSQVVRVPNMGDSITEGTVVEWRHRVGDIVAADEVLCVLETDKVSVEIHSNGPGRLLSIAVDVGGTAFVGGDLAVIEPLDAQDLDSRDRNLDPPPNSPSPSTAAAEGGGVSGAAQEFPRRRRVPLISFGRARRLAGKAAAPDPTNSGRARGAVESPRTEEPLRESRLPSSSGAAPAPLVSRPPRGHSSLVVE